MVLAKANPPKSGDDLAEFSARDAVERVAARAVLANLTTRVALRARCRGCQ
jgi:ethanolamine ammonia-lyase large subunit